MISRVNLKWLISHYRLYLLLHCPLRLRFLQTYRLTGLGYAPTCVGAIVVPMAFSFSLALVRGGLAVEERIVEPKKNSQCPAYVPTFQCLWNVAKTTEILGMDGFVNRNEKPLLHQQLLMIAQ